MVIHTARSRHALALGSFLVLTFALVPNIAYLGHWPVGESVASPHSHEPVSSTTHEEHCHGDSSQCDQPALSGVTWVSGESRPLAMPQAVFQATQAAQPARGQDGHDEVATPPPRSYGPRQSL